MQRALMEGMGRQAKTLQLFQWSYVKSFHLLCIANTPSSNLRKWHQMVVELLGCVMKEMLVMHISECGLFLLSMIALLFPTMRAIGLINVIKKTLLYNKSRFVIRATTIGKRFNTTSASSTYVTSNGGESPRSVVLVGCGVGIWCRAKPKHMSRSIRTCTTTKAAILHLERHQTMIYCEYCLWLVPSVLYLFDSQKLHHT